MLLSARLLSRLFTRRLLTRWLLAWWLLTRWLRTHGNGRELPADFSSGILLRVHVYIDISGLHCLNQLSQGRDRGTEYVGAGLIVGVWIRLLNNIGVRQVCPDLERCCHATPDHSQQVHDYRAGYPFLTAVQMRLGQPCSIFGGLLQLVHDEVIRQLCRILIECKNPHSSDCGLNRRNLSLARQIRDKGSLSFLTIDSAGK